MESFELAKLIANAANLGDQDEVAKLILDNEFDDKINAQRLAISCFELTKVNVKAHKTAALKLTKINPTLNRGITEEFRYFMLVGLLSEIVKGGEIEQSD